ncbi:MULTISPECIES: phage BR0599 family protein [Acinetobacter]|uniref:phage BR0599 family protein n=1 Tax=Acinetobacter TaxID=469 RepID=UPI000BDF6CF0|nr:MULTISPECIES: phage BR0599 family protein [Acinetobacter]
MMNLFKSKKDLFEFKHGDKIWYFTSSAKAVDHNGHTYLPLVVSRGNIDDEDIDKCDTEITFPYPMQILNTEGDDLQALFINKIYYKSVTVTILELYKGETLVIHIGRITQPKFDDDENTMTLVSSTAETQQNKSILTRKFQKTCSNKIYDRICGLKIEAWSVEVTITAINNLTITFTVNPTPVLDENGNPVLDEDGNPVMEIKSYPDNYFSRGVLHESGIFTTVMSSTPSSVSLGRQHFGLHVGSVVKVAPGCDQTRAGPCNTIFKNTSRFMGFVNIPASNPVNDQIIK